MLKKNLTISLPVIDFVYCTKYAMLIKWSTITNIESYKIETKRSMLKSIEIKDYGCFEKSNGWRIP